MSALERRRLLSLVPGTVLTRVGLKIAEGLSEEEWERLVRLAFTLGNAFFFAIGDALYYGKHRHALRYRALMEEYELEFDRVREWVYVAGNVPEAIRREELYFRHHRAVAKLIPSKQERWLALAVERGWTTRELIAAIAEAEAASDDDAGAGAERSAPLEQVRWTFPRERVERWREAAERSGVTFSEWVATALDEAAARA